MTELQTTQIFEVEATWSNAALKAGTTLTIIPAQGANTIVLPLWIVLKMNYGGNNAFTNSRNLSIITPMFDVAPGAAFWQATANSYAWSMPTDSLTGASAAVTNANIDLVLSGGLTGNAANDNTVTVKARYSLLTI